MDVVEDKGKKKLRVSGLGLSAPGRGEVVQAGARSRKLHQVLTGCSPALAELGPGDDALGFWQRPKPSGGVNDRAIGADTRYAGNAPSLPIPACRPSAQAAVARVDEDGLESILEKQARTAGLRGFLVIQKVNQTRIALRKSGVPTQIEKPRHGHFPETTFRPRDCSVAA
jgi:hypothetical protein